MKICDLLDQFTCHSCEQIGQIYQLDFQNASIKFYTYYIAHHDPLISSYKWDMQ